jgi:hypothetical protein
MTVPYSANLQIGVKPQNEKGYEHWAKMNSPTASKDHENKRNSELE